MVENDLPHSDPPQDATPWSRAAEHLDRKLFPEEAETREGRELAGNFIRTLASGVMRAKEDDPFSDELQPLTAAEVHEAYMAYLRDVHTILGSPQQPFTLHHAFGGVQRVENYFRDEESYYETPTAYAYENRAYQAIEAAIQEAIGIYDVGKAVDEAQVNESAQKVTLYSRELENPRLHLESEDAPTEMGRSIAFLCAGALINKVRLQRSSLRADKKPVSIVDVIDFFQTYREGEVVDITLQQVKAATKRKQSSRELTSNFAEDTTGTNYHDIVTLHSLLEQATQMQSEYEAGK